EAEPPRPGRAGLVVQNVGEAVSVHASCPRAASGRENHDTPIPAAPRLAANPSFGSVLCSAIQSGGEEGAMTAQPLVTPKRKGQEGRQPRIDPAAASRWFARLNMHESVANHLSCALAADGSKFLINPRGRHFSRIRASELMLLDARDPEVLDRPDAPDPTAWFIHGRIHARLAHARCIMHLHPRNATVIAALEDSSIP